MSPILYAVNLWLKPVLATGAMRHPARGVRWGGRLFRVCFRPIFAGRWVSVLNKNLLDYFSIRLSTVLYPR